MTKYVIIAVYVSLLSLSGYNIVQTVQHPDQRQFHSTYTEANCPFMYGSPKYDLYCKGK